MTAYLTYAYVAAFRCVGAECPDTCCAGWDMPSDSRQRSLCAARAPELLAVIDPHTNTIQRTPAGECSQLEAGQCRIHARYGSDFLSDSCHFYPRIFRDSGARTLMSANLSCPEIARLVMELPQPFALGAASLDRLPLHRPMADSPDAPAIADACLAHVLTTSHRPGEALARFIALAGDAPNTWPMALRNPSPLPSNPAETADIYRILYGVLLVASLSKQQEKPRLSAILSTMLERLHATFDAQSRELALLPTAANACRQLQADAASHAASIDATLRRWLAAQLTMWGFPFGGYPSLSLDERLRILAFRFAVTRLALQCHLHTPIAAADIVQPLSRLLDHVSDPTLVLDICRDAGWTSPACLQSMLLGA